MANVPVLLPFLYRTRTIIAPTTGIVLRRHRCQVSLSTGGLPRRTVHSFSNYVEAVPFENEQPFAEPATQEKSTLTRFERSVFEDLAEEQSPVAEDDDIIDGSQTTLDEAYDDLSAILDGAIKKEQEQQGRSEASEGPKFHYILQPSTPGPIPETHTRDYERLSSETERLPKSAGEDYRKDKRKDMDQEISKAYRKSVTQRMIDAITDLDIWKILETDVFSLIHLLNKQASADELRPRSALHIEGPQSQMRFEAATRKEGTRPAESALSELRTVMKRVMDQSEGLTASSLSYILQANYSHICLLALRRWRNQYPRTSCSLRLLPHIKSLGQTSYALSISAELYNEIIYAKWTQYQDLHGVVDVIEEMLAYGFRPSIATMELLRSIARTRARDKAGLRGKILRTWWSLRGVREAWQRFRTMYTKVEGEFEKHDPLGKLDYQLTSAGTKASVRNVLNVRKGSPGIISGPHGSSIRKVRRTAGSDQSTAINRRRVTKSASKKLGPQA